MNFINSRCIGHDKFLKVWSEFSIGKVIYLMPLQITMSLAKVIQVHVYLVSLGCKLRSVDSAKGMFVPMALVEGTQMGCM